MALIVDSRQQVFEEPLGSFSTFDFSDQPVPNTYDLYVVVSNNDTSFPVDREFVDTYSELSVSKFGNGYLGPLLQNEFTTYGIETVPYETEYRTYRDTYSNINVTYFGERTIYAKIAATLGNNVGEVWTTKLNTTLSNTATIQTETVGFSLNVAKVGIVKDSFALSNTAEFGYGGYGTVQNTTNALDPNFSYVSNNIVIETETGFGFVMSNTAPIPTQTNTYATNNAFIRTVGSAYVSNTSYFAQQKISHLLSKVGSIAQSQRNTLTNTVVPATQSNTFASQNVRAFMGDTTYAVGKAVVVSGKRKSLQNTVIFPKVLKQYSINSVKVGINKVDFLTNRVIMKTGPSYGSVRNTVKVQKATTTIVNGTQVNTDTFRDPLFNEYVYGFGNL